MNKNSVHEEHPPVAENTPPPPTGDDNLNANISSEGEGSLQPNETSGPSTDPAQSAQLQASIDPQINSSQEQSSMNVSNYVTRSPVTAQYPIVHSFDGWIDELEEFQETCLPGAEREMSVAGALYKLEASKDIPILKLTAFNRNPLRYVEFIEQFKIHIHEKRHLTDDMLVVQLKIHVTGGALRTISGLGSQGIIYATALKTLKDHFGQPSVIARAFINKITEREKIHPNDRQSLRAFSIDIINCVATLRQINYFADVNANDNLRKIIRSLPDGIIEKWKSVATDIREKGEIPQIQHISNFIRNRVKAAFDPDFGDVYKSEVFKERKGIHSNQRGPGKKPKCFVCQGEHRVEECPTMADCTVEERIKHAMDNTLCFSCLVRGHPTRECRSKNKCGKNGCTKMHHPILHADPPGTNQEQNGVASVLDNGSIMPVVRVKFKAENGRVREGNVLVDSGAGTTVIRKDFARALGLQGRSEPIDLAVGGGKRVEQKKSRRLIFFISPLDNEQEFKIEAHEIDNTIVNVQALDRPWLK